MSKNVGNPLSITITGDVHSGKTHLGLVIMKALVEAGYKDVNLICDTSSTAMAERINDREYWKRVKSDHAHTYDAPVTIYEGPVFAAPEIVKMLRSDYLLYSEPTDGIGSKTIACCSKPAPVKETFTEDDWKNAHVLIGSGVSFPMPTLEHALGMTVTLMGRISSVSELPSQDQKLGDGWLHEEEPLKYVLYAWTGTEWKCTPFAGWMNQEFSRRRDAKQMVLGVDAGASLGVDFDGTVIPVEGEPIEITLKGQR